jgi:hypothetical protein
MPICSERRKSTAGQWLISLINITIVAFTIVRVMYNHPRGAKRSLQRLHDGTRSTNAREYSYAG